VPSIIGSTVYFGVDSGASGGVAIIAPNHIRLLEMPAKDGRDKALCDWWLHMMNVYSGFERFAVLELVTGYMRNYRTTKKGKGAVDGENMGSGHSMFKLGVVYGGLRMAMIFSGFTLGDNLVEVTAKKWQNTFELGARGSRTQSQWKARLKQEALELYPHLSDMLTLKTCDALLIAEYARRIHEQSV
jgi:hypothetical protein